MALSDKITILQKVNFDDLYNTFLGMEKRQQVLTGIGLAFLALLLLALPASCVSQKMNEKRSEYEDYVDKASEFFGIVLEYNSLQGGFEKVNASMNELGGDAIGTMIYNLAEEIGIEKSKIELKSTSGPSTESFQEVGKEVRMRNVQLDQVLRFMDRLSRDENLPLNIKKLTLKADQQQKQMMNQVSFTVTTIKPNK